MIATIVIVGFTTTSEKSVYYEKLENLRLHDPDPAIRSHSQLALNGAIMKALEKSEFISVRRIIYGR